MKKQFTIIHNQQGFLLFHVVWIILIVFLCIHFMLYQYQTSKIVAHNQLFHIEIDTISQMAYQKTRKEIDIEEISSSFRIHYDFPQGEVEVTFQNQPNDKLYILFAIKQAGSDHIYQLSRPFF